jgi:hypothetical protein
MVTSAARWGDPFRYSDPLGKHDVYTEGLTRHLSAAAYARMEWIVDGPDSPAARMWPDPPHIG